MFPLISSSVAFAFSASGLFFCVHFITLRYIFGLMSWSVFRYILWGTTFTHTLCVYIDSLWMVSLKKCGLSCHSYTISLHFIRFTWFKLMSTSILIQHCCNKSHLLFLFVFCFRVVLIELYRISQHVSKQLPVYIPPKKQSHSFGQISALLWSQPAFSAQNLTFFTSWSLTLPAVCFLSFFIWMFSVAIASSHSQHVPVDKNGVSSEKAEGGRHSRCFCRYVSPKKRQKKGIFARLLPLPFLSSHQQIVFDICSICVCVCV